MSRYVPRRVRFTVLQRTPGRRKSKLVEVWLSKAEIEAFHRVGSHTGTQMLGWTGDGRRGALHRRLRELGLVLRHNGGFRCYFARLTESGRILHASIGEAARIEACVKAANS